MIGRRSLLIVVSTIFSSFLGLAGLYAMTNFLGKDIYGNFSWIMAMMVILNSLADLGFGSAHIKRMSEGKDESDCVSTYLVIKLVLIAFMVIFAFICLLVWNNVLGNSILPATWNLVISFILYYVLSDLASIAILTFTAKMETTKAQLISLIDPIIRIPLVVFVSVNHMTANELANSYVLSAFCVLIVATFMIIKGGIHWKRPTLFRSYLKFALPIALISIVGVVSYNLDKMLIGYFGTPGSVAFFSSTQTILAILGVVGVAVATVTFPAFSKMHNEGDIDSIRRLTYAAERYISMTGIPIATLIILFPTEVCVALFGSQFAPAGDTMRILAVSTTLTLLNQVYTSQIFGMNRPEISAKIILASFTMNVVLLLVFVPDRLFGIKMLGLSYTGAAIVNTTTALMIFILVRLVVKRLSGTSSNPRILRHIFSGVISGVAIVTLNVIYPIDGIVSFIVFIGVTLLSFFTSLTALKEFTRADIDYFLDLVNPIKMFSYMGDEMKNKR